MSTSMSPLSLRSVFSGGGKNRKFSVGNPVIVGCTLHVMSQLKEINVSNKHSHSQRRTTAEIPEDFCASFVGRM